jgi:predicted O-methyltransferase YrrM
MGEAARAIELPRFNFTNDWFHQSAVVEVWDQIIDAVKPAKILEVGCYEGRATTFMIERCVKFCPVSITCVDTWGGSIDLSGTMMEGVEQRFDENVAIALEQAGGEAVLKKMKTFSCKALPYLLSEGKRFDLIYIDGSHTASDVLSDAVDGFRLLREGGAMIFDDYVWCMEPHGSEDALNMPKPAIDAFVNLYARKLQVVHISGQLALRKTHD